MVKAQKCREFVVHSNGFETVLKIHPLATDYSQFLENLAFFCQGKMSEAAMNRFELWQRECKPGNTIDCRYDDANDTVRPAGCQKPCNACSSDTVRDRRLYRDEKEENVIQMQSKLREGWLVPKPGTGKLETAGNKHLFGQSKLLIEPRADRRDLSIFKEG